MVVVGGGRFLRARYSCTFAACPRVLRFHGQTGEAGSRCFEDSAHVGAIGLALEPLAW